MQPKKCFSCLQLSQRTLLLNDKGQNSKNCGHYLLTATQNIAATITLRKLMEMNLEKKRDAETTQILYAKINKAIWPSWIVWVELINQNITYICCTQSNYKVLSGDSVRLNSTIIQYSLNIQSTFIPVSFIK